jgi:V/A-type H+-transporting ATPase subunit I
MGVLHLTRAPVEAGALALDDPATRQAQDRVEELERRADALCELMGLDADRDEQAAPHPTLAEAEGEINRVESEVKQLTERRARLEHDRKQVENVLRDVSALSQVDAPLGQLQTLSFLHFAFGDMSADDARAAANELGNRAVVFPYQTPYGEDRVVAISSKKGRWTLEAGLEKHGFRREQLPSDQRGVPSRVIALAERRLEGILAEGRDTRDAVARAAGEYGPRLLAARRRLRTERLILAARQNFARTWATMLISGWLPAEQVNELCEKVLDITGHRAVIEIRDPVAEDGDPPTLMKNHPLLRPFEALVSSYSTPSYNEIEPTPFIAVLFLLMFGLMFGDLGHSALLLVGGVLLWRRGRAQLRDAGVVITFCGISGMLFGAVYGTFFGHELGGDNSIFLHPMENTQRLLVFTVLFGIAVITLGIVLNVVNRFRRGEFAEGSLGRFGLLGGVFYWGAIAVAARGVTAGKVSWVLVALLLVAPLLVIFLRRPVGWAMQRRSRPAESEDKEAGEFLIVLIEGAAEAFETVLAYAANTLSFVRIGAFALAHAGLCLAVFKLIQIVREMPGGPVWAVLAFVTGTALIVLLEGLIVAIQSLRLEYYEFFSKFFHGEGRRYQPFTLKA